MVRTSERLTAFLSALDHADPQQFVNPPGLGGAWRARFVRDGLERGVLVVHSTGWGLALMQPKGHAVCRECADSKMRSVCEHCRCEMCLWFSRAEERSSPRVSPEKLRALARRLQTFQMGLAPTLPALDADWSD